MPDSLPDCLLYLTLPLLVRVCVFSLIGNVNELFGILGESDQQ